MTTTRKFHVEVLLKNFANYVNPEGEHDPWFTLPEINQQFAWEDIPDSTLEEWLQEMIESGDVRTDVQDNEMVYAWLF